MKYEQCAPNAVQSSDGYEIGFKGRSRVYFSDHQSTYEISSEYAYANASGSENRYVLLAIDDIWLVDGEEKKAADLSKQKRYFVLSEVIEGLFALGYGIKLIA